MDTQTMRPPNQYKNIPVLSLSHAPNIASATTNANSKESRLTERGNGRAWAAPNLVQAKSIHMQARTSNKSKSWAQAKLSLRIFDPSYINDWDHGWATKKRLGSSSLHRYCNVKKNVRTVALKIHRPPTHL